MLKKAIIISLLFLFIISGSVYIIKNYANPESLFSCKNALAAESLEDINKRGLVPCTITECTFCDLLRLLERINVWLLALAFAVAVFFIVASGFLYITSTGDSGSMSFAKEGLKVSIVGFLICLLSWLAIHLVYVVMEYKGVNGNKTWWKIQCDERGETGGDDGRTVYLNEILPTGLAGRMNPISLAELSKKGLNFLPENKYFFVHGIGGQPVEQAAQQLIDIVKEADSENKTLFAAVPYEELKGDISGGKLFNINNFLLEEKDKEIFENENKSLEEVKKNLDIKEDNNKNRFYDLVLFLLLKSASSEIPFILGEKQTELPQFNGIWPEANWTGIEGDGAPPSFSPNTTIASGMHFEEGNGPVFYDPERYNGEIPRNQTHVQVNLRGNGSLDKSNPVSVLNVAPGVSSEQLEAYLSQVIKVLLATQKRYDTIGEEENFFMGLTDLMTRSITEKLSGSAKQEELLESELGDKEDEKSNTNDNGYYEGKSNKNKNKNSNKNANKNDNSSFVSGGTVTGGSGILPDKIAKDQGSDKLTNKQIEDLIKKILEDSKNEEGSSSGGGGSSGSGGGSGSGSGSSGGSSGDNGWSDTSISSNGYKLNKEEKERLEKMVSELLKEMNLNLPPEFVMCTIQKESAFKPEAVNNNGHEFSVGLMQLNKASGTDKAALSALKRYAPETYRKLLKQHGSDARILDTSSMQSKNDPQGQKGLTNIALGVAYLKKLNAEHKRGNGLRGPDDWDNLAAGYNGGPGGARGRTAYSTYVTACTKTMISKRGSDGKANSAIYFP